MCLYIYLYLYIPTIISIYPTRVRGFTINLELLVKVGIASNYAMDGTDKETTVAAAGTNGMEAAPAMAAGSGSCSCTVVEIDVDDEAEAAAAAPRRTRPRPSIYRVPNHIKNMTNPDAYRPRLVSLGPFHHGEAELQPMEKHKHRAVAHLVERSGKPLREFMAAVEEIAEQLRAAYEDLDDERWSGEEFVELMLTDGCFLLEVMRAFQLQREGKKEEVEEGGDYEADDPVFSEHGYLYLRCDIISDVLVMENQLPLLLLDKLCHVAYADNLQVYVPGPYSTEFRFARTRSL